MWSHPPGLNRPPTDYESSNNVVSITCTARYKVSPHNPFNGLRVNWVPVVTRRLRKGWSHYWASTPLIRLNPQNMEAKRNGPAYQNGTSSSVITGGSAGGSSGS